MDWITEHSLWVLFGFLFLAAVFVITFAARNQRAKTDDGSNLHSDAKPTGTTPLKRSDKV
ncbi:hypothetical protein [Cellvibrio sp.]|uniref:hypothetical protein n=1 Tax=Cellvibrio sp. TaxID=1965322 RepID=UPI0039647C24